MSKTWDWSDLIAIHVWLVSQVWPFCFELFFYVMLDEDYSKNSISSCMSRQVYRPCFAEKTFKIAAEFLIFKCLAQCSRSNSGLDVQIWLAVEGQQFSHNCNHLACWHQSDVMSVRITPLRLGLSTDVEVDIFAVLILPCWLTCDPCKIWAGIDEAFICNLQDIGAFTGCASLSDWNLWMWIVSHKIRGKSKMPMPCELKRQGRQKKRTMLRSWKSKLLPIDFLSRQSSYREYWNVAASSLFWSAALISLLSHCLCSLKSLKPVVCSRVI